VERGVHGVFPLGTNGEFALVDGDERKRVVEGVAGAIDDVPVIAGVGASGTAETVAHARHAERAGADGVVVVTPFYYPLDYGRVLDAVDVPVYVYHIPSKTGNALSLETVSALVDRGVAGVKDSSKDVPFLGQAIDDNPTVTFLSGSDSLVFPGLEVGCAGVVSAVANAFPEFVVDLFEAYDAGDEERARALQSDLYDVRAALKQGPYMAGPKAALSLRGFDAGPLRSPLRGMDADERAALAETLRAYDLL
jgi:4-hydroxy-tetrahydrodipicolinate synthase/2-dehydro-3-deoxy-phosphogluconate/2-dehydro-3-deoxy-6-phosphogalactonate aldolase